MKKDLSKYYAEVTEKDAKKVFEIVNNPFVSEKSIQSSIERGYTSLYSYADSEDFVLGKGVSRKKISLKTLTNYIAYNNQVDRSFVEPKELRKLTEENTTLANGNKELLQKCVFLENEVKILQGTERKKEEVISIQNDMIDINIKEIDKLKKENYSKSVVIGFISFFLLIALIFIAQKL